MSDTQSDTLSRAATEGRFVLPCCTRCGRFAWPERAACPACLGEMAWRPAVPAGRLLSRTEVLVPLDPAFRDRVPVPVGLVRLADGPVALCHLDPGCPSGGKVGLALRLDARGRPVVHAGPVAEGP